MLHFKSVMLSMLLKGSAAQQKSQDNPTASFAKQARSYLAVRAASTTAITGTICTQRSKSPAGRG
jgi:hypothetical protein